MSDPDEILKDPKYRHQHLQIEAAWRFQLVAPLLSTDLDFKAKHRLRLLLLSQKHHHPYRGEIRVSARSLRRWCKMFRDQKFNGLCHRPRRDRGKLRKLSREALETAKAFYLEDSRRSVPQIIRLLTDRNPEWASIKRTTLGRHLRAAGLHRLLDSALAYRKFEARAGNLRWQGDVLHGPKVLVDGKEVTVKVVCWIDDHSRFVVHIEGFDNERLPVLEHTLTRAIAKYGKPECILVDNGKIYASIAFTLACSQLGIRKSHCAPYHPQGKGKQERFFRTLRDQLLNEVENVAPMPLEKFNRMLQAFLTRYHETEHSQTGMTPQARYANTEFVPVSRGELEEAFLQWTKRKVTPQGIISFAGQDYTVDPSLAGLTLIVRYNPFDMARICLWRDGAKLCYATTDTLLHGQLERKPRKVDTEKSSAALRHLEALEESHNRRLELELNMLHLEDETDE